MIKKIVIFSILISSLFPSTNNIIYSSKVFNDSPTLEPIEDQNIDEDTEFSITIIANDPDGDELFYSGNVNNHATISFDDELVVITPELNYNGNIIVTVSVSDDEFTVLDEFILVVNPVNDSPVANDLSVSTAKYNALDKLSLL